MASHSFRLVDDATEALVEWAKTIRETVTPEFRATQEIVRRLGAHWVEGYAEIGFWAPELQDQNISADQIFLELLTPTTPIDFAKPEQEIIFERHRVPLVQDDDYLWGVVEGLRVGDQNEVGTFYWGTYRDNNGNWRYIYDPLAYSVPFGVKAPAEFFDFKGMVSERKDKSHYHERLDTQPDPDGIPRIQAPVNILQIHPKTASPEGTLAGLAQIYRRIAEKIRTETPLTPAEENYIGYDAIQVMPIEPPIEHEAGPYFWETLQDNPEDETVQVLLRQHDITNWGYDVMVAGSPSVNPAMLGDEKRPYELLELLEVLHDFPEKPIKFMLDIVYGHTDNQAIGILNSHYLAGANMYGQNLNYVNLVVRAILIEMQRRKSDYGVDGIRVDGAQDFKWWDPQTNRLHHDDDYLRLMNDIVQEVDGVQYRPWMIFEDGRPWPREDWELASTYREVTKQMPNVWQWGPLTFAHNTPFLFTFWLSKMWRIREMASVGSQWITGCANHDTLRRGTQVPLEARMNTYLGETLSDIFKNGYDNAAAKLFDYAMMPGVPMDFINASMRAPWGFIRNTDDRYGVKVVSEEARFSEWVMTEAQYQNPEEFTRLKAFGFNDLSELRRFMHTLDHTVQMTNYNLVAIPPILNSVDPSFGGLSFTVEWLKGFARAWMDDMHDYCNVWHHVNVLDEQRTSFNLNVREFRRARPWLIENLREEEHFDYLHPADGAALFYGLRISPDGQEHVLFIANMEGAPQAVEPLNLPIPNLYPDGWQLTLFSPGIEVTSIVDRITFHDSQGVVFTRRG